MQVQRVSRLRIFHKILILRHLGHTQMPSYVTTDTDENSEAGTQIPDTPHTARKNLESDISDTQIPVGGIGIARSKSTQVEEFSQNLQSQQKEDAYTENISSTAANQNHTFDTQIFRHFTIDSAEKSDAQLNVASTGANNNDISSAAAKQNYISDTHIPRSHTRITVDSAENSDAQLNVSGTSHKVPASYVTGDQINARHNVNSDRHNVVSGNHTDIPALHNTWHNVVSYHHTNVNSQNAPSQIISEPSTDATSHKQSTADGQNTALITDTARPQEYAS